MITLLCGYPASGKSTFVRDLFEQHDQPLRVVICPDDFRKGICGRDHDPRLEEIVWFAVKSAVRAFLVGELYDEIIVDATALTVGSRQQWLSIGEEYDVPVRVFYFDTPFEVCCERNHQRERVVPQDVMDRMRETFVLPDIDEGFSEVSTIGY